jgi:sugar lactone lactonase YvrE
MRITPLFATALAVTAALAAADTAPPKTHQDYRRESAAAFARNDFAAARTACEAALRLRPDSPRYHYNLALIAMRSEQPADALAALRRLADLGVSLAAEKDESFAPLRANPEFAAILATLAANRAPRGQATELFTLPGMTGIIEGIAFRPATGDWFFGDVHHRCVWRRSADGTVSRFSPPGEVLLGVFQIALDEKRGLLWAATAMLPETSGYTAAQKGRAALVALDLATGKLLRTHPLPTDTRDHVLGDLLLAPDGTVYATDSTAPLVWRLAPGATAPEILVESATFNSLQGLGLLAAGRKLVVTDYANGVLVIDLASKTITPLAPPSNTTLLGLDGFIVEGDRIVAVQNGISPQRIVRITLSPDATRVTAFDVLAAALPGLDDLTLLTRTPAGPVVIAHSGWSAFEDPKSPPTAPHTVRLFRLASN